MTMTSVRSPEIQPPGETMAFDETIRRVRELGPLIKKRADQIEQSRRLPQDVVDELRGAGVFRAAMPAEWGGSELTSMEQVSLVEELASLDSAVGWCAMIGMDSGIYAGYLQPEAARQLFPRVDMITAGWIPPVGQAHETDGGYQVEGHWRFGSGCTHADVIAGGCAVYRGGNPVLDAQGAPLWRIVLAPAKSFTILDTWHTTGLAGTGSCDYTTEGLFVPAEHTLSFAEPVRDAPMYRRSDTILRKMSGVPLGIARAAIDHVYSIAGRKSDGPGLPWQHSRRVQAVVAECEMRLAAARSAVYSSVEAQWCRLVADEPMTRKERADAALARYHAFQTGRNIACTLYDLVGGEATYRTKGPLDRAVRDMATACQHVVGQHRILEWTGQLLLGQEPDTAFI